MAEDRKLLKTLGNEEITFWFEFLSCFSAGAKEVWCDWMEYPLWFYNDGFKNFSLAVINIFGLIWISPMESIKLSCSRGTLFIFILKN